MTLRILSTTGIWLINKESGSFLIVVFGLLGRDVDRTRFDFDISPSEIFAQDTESHEGQASDKEDEAQE